MNIIKRFWKVITCVLILAVISGGYIAYVAAANEPVVHVTMPENNIKYVYNSDETNVLTGSIANLNLDGTISSGDLMEGNLFWYTDNPQVIGFVVPGENNTVGTSRGISVTIRALKAGNAKVYVRYYFNPDNHNELVNPDNLDAYAYVTYELVPFQVNLDVTLEPDKVYEENKVYDGTGITFKTNAYYGDKIVVDGYTDGVINIGDLNETGDQVIVSIIGGGKSDIIIRTTSGRDPVSNMYIEGLYKKYTVYGKVNFGTSANNYEDYYDINKKNKYFDIDSARYGITQIPSNIIPEAGVGAASSDTNVATFDPDSSSVTPVGAGIALITAGVKDSEGNFMVYENPAQSIVTKGYDSIYVRVPLMIKVGNLYVRQYSTNMGIGDYYNIQLNNAKGSAVLYSSDDTDVATVSPDGRITAVGLGVANIKAKVSSGGDAATFEDEIEIAVVVGDMFTLSNTNHEMNIGDTYDLELITSIDILDAPIAFSVNGVTVGSGTEISGMSATIDSDNPKLLHLKALREGTYTIVVTQTIDGLVKTATAIVYVRTGVTGISISPKEVYVGIGGQYTLSAVVTPGTAYNKDIVWVSSDTSKLTVEKTSDYEAVITGLDGGTVNVTAVSASDGTVYDICVVHVTKDVTGVELSETNVSVNMTTIKQYQLIATVFPENTSGTDDGINRKVEWKSSDESVLKVDENGLVTFVGPGYATVEVKTVDGGYTALCNFTVAVPVETVEISSENIKDMLVGQQITLTAEVLPLTASNRTVKWSSSDTNICTIDTNGKMTAVGPGDVVIWCHSLLDGNIYDYITVHVIEPVDGIVLNLSETTVRKGTEFWLYATVFPVTAEYKEIKWTSSDEKIATVDEYGKVNALLPGTVTITAINPHSGNSASCVVTVTESVTSITLKTGDSEEMFVGAKYTIVPEILPIDAEDKSVTYFSSDETIAKVDKNGVVSALKGGECDIVVTTNDRQLTAYCHITVKEYVSTIKLDKDFTYINIDSGTTLVATVGSDTASNKSITWSSSNTDIVTVDQGGYVYGKAIGTAVITATAADGGGAVATCVVQVVHPVTGIKLGNSVLNMYQGETKIISVTVEPRGATVKALKWESSDPSIATVDEDGEVTAVAPGKCKVTATSTDGNNVTATCTVYVKSTVNATGMTLTPSTVNFRVGETRNLTVRTTPTNVTETISWITSDPTVVLVDGNGQITAIGEGAAVITAYGRVSGVQATCNVTVDSAVVKATSLKLNTDQIIMLAGKTRAIQYRLLPTNSTERINWISSDPSVATVDSDGIVTTVGPGRCEIIAQSSLGGIETRCTVYSMALSKTSLTMQQYDPFQLYVDGIPDGTTVSWRTGNPRIATVSATGEVIGRKEGTTTITATINDKTLTCVVKITDATKY